MRELEELKELYEELTGNAYLLNQTLATELNLWAFLKNDNDIDEAFYEMSELLEKITDIRGEAINMSTKYKEIDKVQDEIKEIEIDLKFNLENIYKAFCSEETVDINDIPEIEDRKKALEDLKKINELLEQADKLTDHILYGF